LVLWLLLEPGDQILSRRHAADRPERAEDPGRERAAVDTVAERDQRDEETDEGAGQRREDDRERLRGDPGETVAPCRDERRRKRCERKTDERKDDSDVAASFARNVRSRFAECAPAPRCAAAALPPSSGLPVDELNRLFERGKRYFVEAGVGHAELEDQKKCEGDRRRPEGQRGMGSANRAMPKKSAAVQNARTQ